MEPKNERKNPKGASVFEMVAWGGALFAYAPACISLAYYCAAFSQLSEAFLTLLFASIAVAADFKMRPKPALSFGKRSFGALLAAYALFFLSTLLLNTPYCAPVLFAGLTAALMSFGYAVLRRADFRFVNALGCALYVYAIGALLMPLFDMPLRFLAGLSSAKLMELFGAKTALAFLEGSEKFILLFCGKPFEVARECNGFGLMASCLTLSILLLFLSEGRDILKKTFLAALCLLIAFAANTMRIVCIVLTAPHISIESYHAMHEAYGYAFFLAALFACWRICRPHKENGRAQ